MKIPLNISDCEKLVKQIFGDSTDVVSKTYQTTHKKALMVYIDGLVSIDWIDRDLIKPLKSPDFNGNLYASLNAPIKEVDNVQMLIGDILDGNVVIFYEILEKFYP
jgi:hypothetical protein